MDVLKHALRVSFRADSQVFLIFVSPEFRKFADIQIFLDQHFLQFIAHQHMKAVGQLIGLRADQARLDFVDGTDKHFSSHTL